MLALRVMSLKEHFCSSISNLSVYFRFQDAVARRGWGLASRRLIVSCQVFCMIYLLCHYGANFFIAWEYFTDEIFRWSDGGYDDWAGRCG